MTPSEYLDAAKNAIGITSDNALAERLHENRGTISAIRDGKRPMPTALAYKIAITLKHDPAVVIADLEEQRETNIDRVNFWRSFLSRAALLAILACTLAWTYSAHFANEPNLLGGIAATSAAFYALGLRIICIM